MPKYNNFNEVSFATAAQAVVALQQAGMSVAATSKALKISNSTVHAIRHNPTWVQYQDYLKNRQAKSKAKVEDKAEDNGTTTPLYVILNRINSIENKIDAIGTQLDEINGRAKRRLF